MRIAIMVFFACIFHKISYSSDFYYSYQDPRSESSRKYINNTSNVVPYREGPVTYWKQDIGSAYRNTCNPGIIDYKFDFGADKIKQAKLYIKTTTYNWGYSDGYSKIEASPDNSQYITLVEADTPGYGLGNVQIFDDSLPAVFTGKNKIHLRVSLCSFGENAVDGGIMTNTAQHSRYTIGSGKDSFRLEVDFLPKLSIDRQAGLFIETRYTPPGSAEPRTVYSLVPGEKSTVDIYVANESSLDEICFVSMGISHGGSEIQLIGSSSREMIDWGRRKKFELTVTTPADINTRTAQLVIALHDVDGNVIDTWNKLEVLGDSAPLSALSALMILLNY